jgi:hypothetical protein
MTVLISFLRKHFTIICYILVLSEPLKPLLSRGFLDIGVLWLLLQFSIEAVLRGHCLGTAIQEYGCLANIIQVACTGQKVIEEFETLLPSPTLPYG